MRVALFGSFYRGFFVLKELFEGPFADRVEVVGVATDDPSSGFVSAGRRVWQYGYTEAEARMVSSVAYAQNIEAYTGRVKTEAFYDLYEQTWRPDICIMATFGQKIDSRLYDFPIEGFFNLHPSDREAWPSKYAGPDPFTELLKDGHDRCVLTLHRVDGEFDTGERIFTSDLIPIPIGAQARTMHMMSGPYAAMVARRLIAETLEKRALKPANSDVQIEKIKKN